MLNFRLHHLYVASPPLKEGHLHLESGPKTLLKILDSTQALLVSFFSLHLSFSFHVTVTLIIINRLIITSITYSLPQTNSITLKL